MKTVAIIQARLASTRLPRKVLKPIGGYASLYHTIRRTQLACPHIMVAIPWPEQELALFVRGCNAENLGLFRGPPEDVLARYLGAAEEAKADVVIRITGDCPLVDPEIVQRVARYVEEDGAEYASNVWPWRTYPQGLDVEAFTMDLLRRAAVEAKRPYDREHVTPYMHGIAERVECLQNGRDLSHHRWTLDTFTDYVFFQKLAEHLTWKPPHPTTDEVLALVEKHPEIAAIPTGVAHA